MPGEMSENWSEYTLTKAILLVSHQQCSTMQGAAAEAKGGTATSLYESKLHKKDTFMQSHSIYTSLMLFIAKHAIGGNTPC